MPDRPNAPPRAWQRMLSGRRLDLLDPSPLDMEHFAMACDMLFARVPQDPEELADMLATPQDGPRLLEIQVR